MGTKNNPGNYDCYENAEPDEPMFVLLARDPLAPFLVRLWVEHHRDRRIREWDAKDKNAQEAADYPYGLDEKEMEAMACASTMEIWAQDERKDGKPVYRGRPKDA